MDGRPNDDRRQALGWNRQTMVAEAFRQDLERLREQLREAQAHSPADTPEKTPGT